MAFANATLPEEIVNERAPNQLHPELLRRLYACMLKCRMVEERIRVLYRQGRFAGNYFAATGQEATEVGATIDLLPEDTVAPSHRNFITNIMNGTPLNLMFAHIYG
ncbi:MAG: thiamine pyrophosphate-dependent enzyme, partial [Terracidiphilus sp.]